MDDFQWWRNRRVATGYRVGWRWRELDYIEYRVEAPHWEGQPQSVRIAGDLFFNWKGAKPMVGELPRWSGGLDV